MNSNLRRRVLAEMKSLVALIAIALVGTVIGVYIVAHQRIHPPSWMPVVGTHEFVVRVKLQNAQGVLPGQGQMVTVSGVQVGRIASVDLENGAAVATLALQPKYAHVYPDATVLMRPKTGLKDMVAELDPGSKSSGSELESGSELGSNHTNPDVNFDEILASLDRDTRDELRMLVQGAGIGLSKGGGHDLANTFRRFDPLSRHVALATQQVALRRARLKHVMANLSRLATELGRHDRELGRFVSSSEAVFARFAHQSANLQRTVSLLPGALDSSDRALSKVTTLGRSLRKTLGDVEPTARALAPTLRDLRPFFRDTAPVFEDSLRPFAVAAQPTARKLVPAAHDLASATPDLKKLADVLNAIVDELAYDPPGPQRSYLFYIPWASHNTNSTLAQADGIAPLRRGLVFIGCGPMQILEALTNVNSKRLNPTLSTLIQLLQSPDYRQLIAEKKCPFTPPPGAGRAGAATVSHGTAHSLPALVPIGSVR